MVVNSQSWQNRIGHQREVIWRGWQTRYSYLKGVSKNASSQPPIFLIHGFGASIEHWRNNVSALNQNHSIYALDLLGFGASKKIKTTYTVDLWVEQVHDLWQSLTDKPIIIIGNSIGSLICISAALKYPKMVQGIAMLSLPDVSIREEMIPRPFRPIVKRIENLVASPLLIKTLLKVARRPNVIRKWAKIAYEDEESVNDELVKILSCPAYDLGAEDTFYSLFTSIREPQFSIPAKEILPQLNIPMLLIWGKQDRMVPLQFAKSFAQMNNQLELILLDDVGHCPHDEKPKVFNKIIVNWLTQKFDSQL